MLEPVFTFFDKLIDQFSWRRLIVCLSLVVTVALCLIAYEAYTGAFGLKRLERIVSVVEALRNLSPTAEAAAHLDNTLLNVSKDLESFSSNATTAFDIDPRILKGIAAFAPWLLLLIVFPLSPGGGTKQAIGGVLVVAIPAAVLGAFLPDFQHAWLNYVLYPLASFALLLGAVTIWHSRKRA